MVEKKYIHTPDEDLFRLLLEFKDYAVIRIGTNGDIMSWNLGAAHLYGYSFGEAVGRSLSCLYVEEIIDSEDSVHLAERAIRTGRHEEEGWMKRKDGTTFYANTIISALYNETRVVTGFAHVTRDITATKQLEQENQFLREGLEEKVKQRTKDLEVVNKELEAFSYSVSHDLRTPLRAVSGYSMMLKEDYQAKLDVEGNRIIDTILANTKMMGDLIDDLLTFSKMARLEAIHASVDMHQLVKHCLEKLTMIEKRSAVSIDLLPPCKGDQSMLRQVWFNLLDNAVKYSSRKEAPQIEIGAKENQRFYIYYVKDNGTGFDMKYAHKLFGVFQRLHRQDEFEGTGLGLALAKRIVSKHGGEIWAEAVPLKGAIFYFSIPK